MLEAVIQHRSHVVEHIAADLRDRLHAPFIKGLSRDAEAGRHARFVQPMRFTGDGRIGHELNNNLESKIGHI
ncbi:hypothetical protein D9M71_227280 [compost metagenome]